MKRTKINMTFDIVTVQRPLIASIITRCIEKTLELEHISVPCEINVLVTDDPGIRAINKASRGIDKATDVLSFPMFDLQAGEPPKNWTPYIDPETNMCPLGDMAISFERAVAQAKEFGHTTRREIGYLTIHSMLHLLGYDHLDEGAQKACMRTREEKIASSLRGMRRTNE